MNKRFLYICMTLLFGITTLLSSCGNKGDAPDETPTPTPTLGIETPAPRLEPDFGGTLIITMRQPQTLNPLLNEDETVARVLSLVYENLFILDDDLKPMPNPALVSDYVISADGKTVTLTIKDGIRWSNGEAITAADVAFSINYLKSTAPDTSIYKGCAANLLSAAVSGGSVRINLIQPSGQIGYDLCFPIISEGYYKGASAASSKQMNPVGNGPFMFQSYAQSQEMLLSASPWPLRGPAYIENIKVLITNSDEADVNAFLQGVTDVVTAGVSTIGRIKGSLSTTRVAYPSSYFDFIAFNFDNWHLTDKNIRTAIAYCVPYNNLTVIYQNAAAQAAAPINPASWLSSGNPGARTADLEAAVLRVEGWEGLAFRILVNEENLERCGVAEELAKNLRAIRIEATIEAVSWDVYLEKLNQGDFDIILGGYNLSWQPDLAFLLHSKNADDTYQGKNLVSRGTNLMHYKDGEMDRLLDVAYKTIGNMESYEAFARLQAYLAEELPLAGLVFREQSLFVNSRVMGAIKSRPDNVFTNIEEWYINVK